MAMADRRLIHIDMFRGLAAIGVMVGHARSFAILDYSITEADALWIQAFYFITGLGHQCVIGFFALSGFLVGGPALRHILDGNWVWPRYMVRRLTRLWMVLIPALLLTLGLDTAGTIMGGRAGYEGAFYDLIHSGPKSSSPADLSITTLAGNALFLQTILVPTFGSNGPLWSLANEFWYYIIFPFLLVGLIARSWSLTRAVMGVVGIILAVLLPGDMVLLGLIWIAGALAHYSLRFIDRPATQYALLMGFALALLLVVGATVLDKIRPGLASDLVLGGAFACILPTLTLLPNLGVIYSRVARNLANISYTLYATHFPVLAFIWFVVLAPHKWAIGSTAAIVMGSLIVTTLAVAAGMWWLFERNTDRIRNVVESWLVLRAAT
jgi:peptidoglycan/LPS O-acetylase OafA/YrhL